MGYLKFKIFYFEMMLKCMWVVCKFRPPTYVNPTSCGPIVTTHN